MLLSLLNAGVSHLTIFRCENTWSADMTKLFTACAEGVQYQQQLVSSQLRAPGQETGVEGDEDTGGAGQQSDDGFFIGQFLFNMRDIFNDPNGMQNRLMEEFSRLPDNSFIDAMYPRDTVVHCCTSLGLPELYTRDFAKLFDLIEDAPAFGGGGRAAAHRTKLFLAMISINVFNDIHGHLVRARVKDLSEVLPTAVAVGLSRTAAPAALTPSLAREKPLQLLDTGAPFAPAAEASNVTDLAKKCRLTDGEAVMAQQYSAQLSDFLGRHPDAGLLLKPLASQTASAGSFAAALQSVDGPIRADFERQVLHRDGANHAQWFDLFQALWKLLHGRRHSIVSAWLEANLKKSASAEAQVVTTLRQSQTSHAALIPHQRIRATHSSTSHAPLRCVRLCCVIQG